MSEETKAVDTEVKTTADNSEVLGAIASLAESMKATNDRLTAIENEPSVKAGYNIDVIEDETDKKAARPWKSLGEQLKAVANAAMYPHSMDDRLKAQKAALGQNELVGADGGFLVQTDFANGIFSIEHGAGELAQRCRRIPISPNANGLRMNAISETSRATGSRWGGVRGYWVGEANTITASDIAFRQMEFSLNKLAAAVYATDELLADTTALGNVINQAVSEELAFLLDNSIINGTGAGQPLGILNSGALVSVAKENNQAATTVVYENVLKVWSRAHARSRMSPNAVWVINQDVESQLNSMSLAVGTGGMPVYLPPGGLSTSPYATLMGKPVVPTEFQPTLGTVGDIMLIDFDQYLLVDKGGTQANSSMHVQFLTDQMVYKFIYRVDGQPLWNSALTPFQGSNTQSPYVAVATR